MTRRVTEQYTAAGVVTSATAILPMINYIKMHITTCAREYKIKK